MTSTNHFRNRELGTNQPMPLTKKRRRALGTPGPPPLPGVKFATAYSYDDGTNQSDASFLETLGIEVDPTQWKIEFFDLQSHPCKIILPQVFLPTGLNPNLQIDFGAGYVFIVDMVDGTYNGETVWDTGDVSWNWGAVPGSGTVRIHIDTF
jgi:hypothetical protein